MYFNIPPGSWRAKAGRSRHSVAFSILALITGATLAACTHVPITAYPALAAINFATTDLSSLRAAVEMPNSIQPTDEGVRLNLNLSVEGDLVEERSYVLQREQASDATVPHPTPVAGRQIYVYRLSQTDQRGLEAVRADVLDRKEDGQRGSLSIGVAVEEMCEIERRDGETAANNLPVDVFLRTSETDRFVRTLDGFDLNELRAGDDPIIPSLPTCAVSMDT